MAIRFSCESCGKRLSVKDEYAGRRSKCPACGWGIVVPFQTASKEDDKQISQPAPLQSVPPPIPSALAQIKTDEEDDPSESEPLKPKYADTRRPRKWVVRAVVGTGVTALVLAFAKGYARLKMVGQPTAAPELVAVPTTALDASAPRYAFLSSSVGEAIVYEWGKDVFSIRLSKKVSKAVLEKIAREIESNKPRNPRTGTRNFRTVIFCYLPEVDAFEPNGPFGSPWALVDLNGPIQQEASIYGLTIDEETMLVAKYVPPAGNIIGQWLEDSLAKSLWIIYQRAGVFYLSHAGKFEQELVGFGPQPFRLFERKKPSKAADYYRINERGDLECRDDNGLNSVARRL